MIEICVYTILTRTCDMNSTLGSVVPLAMFLQTYVYWSTSIVWRSLTTTGAWDGDDAAWTFADRGGAEKDGC